jgi:DNA-binding protein HU-beta
MNKAQIVARVARETGLTQADVLRVLDALLDTVVRALRKGEPVKLVDFGTFLVTRRRSRPGHNPRTGQPMRIAGRRWPRFSAGKGLRQAVAERRPRGGAAASLDEPAPPPARPARSRTATVQTPGAEGAPAPARPSGARPAEDEG